MKFNSISVKVLSRPIFFLKTYIFRGCTAAQSDRRRIGSSIKAFARKGERRGGRGERKRPRRMAKKVEALVKVVVVSRRTKKSWRKNARARWKY